MFQMLLLPSFLTSQGSSLKLCPCHRYDFACLFGFWDIPSCAQGSLLGLWEIIWGAGVELKSVTCRKKCLTYCTISLVSQVTDMEAI